jgi:hypothetical protein
MRFVQWIAAILAFVFLTANASASNVLMTFDDFRPAGITSNTAYQGFWVSPSCSLGVGSSAQPSPLPNYLTFTASGCGALFNPNYLGPSLPQGRCQGCVFIGRTDGGTFDLDSFDAIRSPFSVTSSAGGERSIQQPSVQSFPVTFAGPEWDNLSWIVLEYGGPGEGHGLDNIALTVPVPHPMILGSAGLALLLLVRRFR